jgi:hypothetical protein
MHARTDYVVSAPLGHSVYAVVTNLYAFMMYNKSIQLQSRVPYVAALQSLHGRIVQAQEQGLELKPTELEVNKSPLLIVYEMRSGET